MFANVWYTLIDLLGGAMDGIGELWLWLNYPIVEYGTTTITPLGLFTVGGITALLVYKFIRAII